VHINRREFTQQLYRAALSAAFAKMAVANRKPRPRAVNSLPNWRSRKKLLC
jgi:hypothetical protein